MVFITISLGREERDGGPFLPDGVRTTTPYLVHLYHLYWKSTGWYSQSQVGLFVFDISKRGPLTGAPSTYSSETLRQQRYRLRPRPTGILFVSLSLLSTFFIGSVRPSVSVSIWLEPLCIFSSGKRYLDLCVERVLHLFVSSQIFTKKCGWCSTESSGRCRILNVLPGTKGRQDI